MCDHMVGDNSRGCISAYFFFFFFITKIPCTVDYFTHFGHNDVCKIKIMHTNENKETHARAWIISAVKRAKQIIECILCFGVAESRKPYKN